MHNGDVTVQPIQPVLLIQDSQHLTSCKQQAGHFNGRVVKLESPRLSKVALMIQTAGLTKVSPRQLNKSPTFRNLTHEIDSVSQKELELRETLEKLKIENAQKEQFCDKMRKQTQELLAKRESTKSFDPAAASQDDSIEGNGLSILNGEESNSGSPHAPVSSFVSCDPSSEPEHLSAEDNHEESQFDTSVNKSIYRIDLNYYSSDEEAEEDHLKSKALSVASSNGVQRVAVPPLALPVADQHSPPPQPQPASQSNGFSLYGIFGHFFKK
jgi:hypothetical protein